MRLNVQKIMNVPGERVEFRFEADFSHVDFGGTCPAVQPVSVVGQVENEAGVLVLDMTVSTVLDLVCDRCGTPFRRPMEFSVEYLLAEQLQDEQRDDILLLEEDTVDLGELARTEFILHMDSKSLCREDCKGLCPGCGANLNEESCTCKKQVDPRLAVLAKLLEKSE